jgi:hypothetical protein
MAAPQANVRSLFAVIALVATITFCGCEKHPFEEKISARNDLGFSMWLSDHTGQLNADERRELTEARQQIKFAVMTDTPGLNAQDFEQNVYAEIYGHTVKEVLLRGLEIQQQRLSKEITALEKRETRYRQVDPKKLEPDAREFLENFTTRLTERRVEIQRMEQRRTLIKNH